MSKKRFQISGQVINRQSRRGVAGLRVEAWDRDLIFDDLVGSAVTDQQGVFIIEFTESYFREFFLDRKPDLFFKVYRDEELITSTESSVLWNQKSGESPIVIEVDVPSEGTASEALKKRGLTAASRSFTVTGTVRLRRGEVKKRQRLLAFDLDLRGVAVYRTLKNLAEIQKTEASSSWIKRFRQPGGITALDLRQARA